MSTSDKPSPLLYALASLAAILGAALFMQGWRGSRATAILRTVPRKINLAKTAKTLIRTDDLRIIEERALFYATRKVYAPLLASPIASRLQLSRYQLIGTLLVPQKQGVAFVRQGPAGKTTTISPGNQLDGWTVKAVQSGKAVFAYEDQRVTLTTAAPLKTSPPDQNVAIIRMPVTQTVPYHPSTTSAPGSSVLVRSPP